MNIPVSHIRDTLQNRKRKVIIPDEHFRAAVLMPLVRSSDSFEILLTKRTEGVEHHKGQISFPGGMVDSQDTSSTDTALRETEEEIGLSRSGISILGMLDDIHIPSGFVVTPIVGYIEKLPTLSINNGEVAEIFQIPIEKFFDIKLQRSEIRELKGIRRKVYFYDVWKEPVWGATAAVIKQFIDLFSPQ